MKIAYMIDHQSDIAEKTRSMLAILRLLQKYGPYGEVETPTDNSRMYYTVGSRAGLQTIRHQLRATWGHWADHLVLVHGGLNNTAVAKYHYLGTAYPQIHLGIVLRTKVSEFPQELVKEGCGFKKKTISFSTTRLLCEL